MEQMSLCIDMYLSAYHIFHFQIFCILYSCPLPSSTLLPLPLPHSLLYTSKIC